MNESGNGSQESGVSRELRIIVERAVRPVRASMVRKRKIREELLVHVNAVFVEEAAKTDDEQAALSRTARRFGDPVQLAEQLQCSIPARDVLARIMDRLWFRSGESRRHHFLRLLAGQAIVFICFLPVWRVWILVSDLIVRLSDWPKEEPTLFGGPVLLFDWFFYAFFSLALIWFLPQVDRRMASKIRCHQEWESLRIE